MTIAPGAKYSPVCLKNRLGYRPDQTTQLEVIGTVTPCRLPWQMPIGVFDASLPSDYCNVQISGDFPLDLAAGDLYTSGSELPGHAIGRRVYYEAESSRYVAVTKTNIGEPVTTMYGKYPGAATIGYIKDVSGTDFTIHIDPQPATAKYITGMLPSGPRPVPGTPVVVNPETHLVTAWTSTKQTCDGVLASYISYSSGHYIAIVCVGGPAWVFPTATQLYSYMDQDELEDAYELIQGIPIGADFAFRPVIDGDDFVPIVGYAELSAWSEIGATGNNRLLINVCPNNPTRYEEE